VILPCLCAHCHEVKYFIYTASIDRRIFGIMPQVSGAGARAASDKSHDYHRRTARRRHDTLRVLPQRGPESGASPQQANTDGGAPDDAPWRQSGVRDRRSHCAPWDSACLAIAAARAGDASLYRCAEVYHVACLVFRRGSWSHTGCRQTTECHDLRHGYGHFRPPLLCRQLVASQSTTMRLAALPAKAARVVVLIR
jgi:hypothetical protein